MTEPEEEFITWVKDVYRPAMEVISGAFQESTGSRRERPGTSPRQS